jgi:hypothetical protein
MAQVQVAETNKPRAKAKVLDHVSIHPRMGGGHVVKHSYTSYQHEPMEVHFGEDGKRVGKGGGEHIVSHLIKHAGLPSIAGGEGKTADETED